MTRHYHKPESERYRINHVAAAARSRLWVAAHADAAGPGRAPRHRDGRRCQSRTPQPPCCASQAGIGATNGPRQPQPRWFVGDSSIGRVIRAAACRTHADASLSRCASGLVVSLPSAGILLWVCILLFFLLSRVKIFGWALAFISRLGFDSLYPGTERFRSNRRLFTVPRTIWYARALTNSASQSKSYGCVNFQNFSLQTSLFTYYIKSFTSYMKH